MAILSMQHLLDNLLLFIRITTRMLQCQELFNLIKSAPNIKKLKEKISKIAATIEHDQKIPKAFLHMATFIQEITRSYMGWNEVLASNYFLIFF